MSHSAGGQRADLAAIAHQAMIDRGLLPDFSPAVMAEVARIGPAPHAGDAPTTGGSSGASHAAASIRDLRHLLWSSIDNDDSLDLDQIEVAEELPGGNVRVLVGIADVTATVADGSAIDGHARHNTTSVYTAARIFSMLPERLSTDLTSLAEGEERLSVVVEMVVDAEGGIVSSEIYRARVLNRAKLAYNSVAPFLEGAGPAPARAAAVAGIEAQLRLQDKVAQCLRAVRHAQGALTLETIEPRPVFTGDALVDLEVERKNRAKELIEDLMIAANGVTARFLEARRMPSLRRVLRSPERWQRIVELAAGFGDKLPPEPDSAALEAFLADRQRADPLRFPDVSLSVVKMMGSGEYAVDLPGATPPGHFGLAVRDYTHSTAPNRRYPDVITQRLLKAALAGGPAPYAAGDLGELARHCTEMEDAANKVERQVRKSAGALLLANRLGERFDAVVTGASEKGTWVRLLHPPIEGKLVHGFDGLDVGDRLHVKLTSTDVERGFIDFVRVGAS